MPIPRPPMRRLADVAPSSPPIRRLALLLRHLGGVVVACSMAPWASAGEATIVAEGVDPRPPGQPQAAVDADGAIHVVWGAGDLVFHRRAEPGGTSFGPTSELSLAPVMALGMRRGPRIAASRGSVCVTGIGGPLGKGRDGDVWAVRTTDGGRTWSDPVRLNAVEGSAREGLHGMASGPAGELCCAWLDLRNGRTEIMAATSADGGSTWSRDVLVYRSPEKNVCECCHPSVAYGADGSVLVQWRNSLGGDRDMFFARSDDGGTSFGEARKLGRGSWPLAACPMDGGAIAARGDDVVSVWRRDRTVYLVEGADATERAIGGGEQPWLVGTAAGPIVTWVASRGGRLLLLPPGERTAITLAERATDPALAVGPAPGAPAIVVWEQRHEAGTRVLCRVIAIE